MWKYNDWVNCIFINCNCNSVLVLSWGYTDLCFQKECMKSYFPHNLAKLIFKVSIFANLIGKKIVSLFRVLVYLLLLVKLNTSFQI